MHKQNELFPTGLTRLQFEQLADKADKAAGYSTDGLVELALRHVERAWQAHAENPIVNAHLAQAVGDVISRLAEDWDSLPPASHSWLRAAIYYFAAADDSEPDFSSAIGFEDDVELLNACLIFAGRGDLVLNPEDYDDA